MGHRPKCEIKNCKTSSRKYNKSFCDFGLSEQ